MILIAQSSDTKNQALSPEKWDLPRGTDIASTSYEA